MKQRIDILIINNAPAFYKVNLYNELAKKCSIHVIFLALTNQVVIGEMDKDEIFFSFEILLENQIEFRNKYYSFMKLYVICEKYSFKKIIYGGYDTFECFFLPFFISKKKNCLQFESSIKESKVTGYFAIIKKLLLRRFSIALPSGKLQSAVFKALNFNGKIIETYGVGIFNKKEIIYNKINTIKSKRRYIYVGRLIELKNLKFLIGAFNKLNKQLTIVGTGELESKLKQLANKNITFSGFVPNQDIYKWYLNHDIFVLPSLIEPWGLVVEEAVYFGLPVIVSEAVGCQEEMVLKPNTGLSFSPYNQTSLIEAINQIEANYDIYKNNCCHFDFDKRDMRQIEAYLKILD
jgi:glycosyltransferase involved in cell wall biosynthesis